LGSSGGKLTSVLNGVSPAINLPSPLPLGPSTVTTAYVSSCLISDTLSTLCGYIILLIYRSAAMDSSALVALTLLTLQKLFQYQNKLWLHIGMTVIPG